MLGLIAFWACMSTLPEAGSVQTIGLGESCSVRLQGGTAWVRVLEQDYAFLRITADPAASLTAFDENEGVLAQASAGHDLILSAFSNYWFYIRIDGRDGSTVTVRASEEPPSVLAASLQGSGNLTLGQMGCCYRFVAPSDGVWRFDLRGSGSMDLDLEVYGPDMSLLAAGYSRESTESASCAALRGDTLMVVVSRYSKGGSGEYAVSASRQGDIPVLSHSTAGTMTSEAPVARMALGPQAGWSLLRLSSTSDDGDLDLYVLDSDGSVLWSSSSYSSFEAIMVPPGRSGLTAEARAYDLGSSGRLRYQMSLVGDVPVRTGTSMEDEGELSNSDAMLEGFAPGRSGLYTVSARFEKLRDGDLQFFRGGGPCEPTPSSARGDERFVIWIADSDTVWLYPTINSLSSSAGVSLAASAFDGPSLSGTARGALSPDDPVASWSLVSAGNSIESIRLHGEDRDTDFDMFVSGPGIDRAAQGGLSNADAAGDEEVAFFCPESATFGVTVYTYERRGAGEFALSARSIPKIALAAPAPSAETWAVLAGIGGYPSSADALNRAGMDALDFYRFLADGQGVPADHIVLLVDEMATVQAFEGAIGSVLQRAGQEDKVIVFFSGHGDQHAPGSGGPEEADAMNEALCLYDGEVEDDWLASSFGASRAPVLLFADACHSGGLVNDFGPGSNAMILTAAREDRSVSERILTPILLEGAHGAADSDRNGIITARELMDYVDSSLQLICPVCDARIQPGDTVCPECGAVLKGENQVPRPEQGFFLDSDIDLWRIPPGGRNAGE